MIPIETPGAILGLASGHQMEESTAFPCWLCRNDAGSHKQRSSIFITNYERRFTAFDIVDVKRVNFVQ